MNSQGFRFILKCLTSGILFCSFHAQAQVNVYDDGFSLDPATVNIVTGESVSWTDDGNGYNFLITDQFGGQEAFQIPVTIQFNQAGTYSYYDENGSQGYIIVAPNIPPTVTITNPVNQVVLSAPATFDFAVDAEDTDVDGLSDVQFYVGADLVDDVFIAPFTTTITNLAPGTYTLTAIAYDNAGATATNSITITVANGVALPITLATPQIVAGAFQFQVTGLIAGKTNIIEMATNITSLANWMPLVTNVASFNTMSFTNATISSQGYFRVIQLP
jgi:hypothetical protein